MVEVALIGKDSARIKWQQQKKRLTVEKEGLFWWLSGKESACNAGEPGFGPWVRKILWRRKWQLIPVFLPGESQGQRSLVSYSPWSLKET